MVGNFKQMLKTAKYLTRDCTGYVLWDERPNMLISGQMFVLSALNSYWCRVSEQSRQIHFGGISLGLNEIRPLPLLRVIFHIIQAGHD